jgi:chromosome segregation ATPase
VAILNSLRNLFGRAPADGVDPVEVARASARDAREAADEMKSLVARVREDHGASIAKVEGELARLSVRVESMPEMRAQLEQFVQSLGRTMTSAAERLETVDDRIHQLEQQARAQTEIIALSRTELDRQGRTVGGLDAQLKSLEAAIERLAAASAATEALVRDLESRRVRSTVALVAAIAAVCLALVAFVVARSG